MKVSPPGASFVRGDAADLIDDTIGGCFDKMVAAQPDVDALVVRHQDIWSYTELDEQVERCARAFLALGVRLGDRVGIWSPNNAEWVVVQFATAKIGAILVNVNPAYRAGELEYALVQSGVRVLVTADSYRSTDYLALLSSVRDRLPRLERVVIIGNGRAGVSDDLAFDEMVAGGESIDAAVLTARASELSAHDPINIQYTSGTTGRPKGATLTHHNILNNARIAAQVVGYTWADRVCIPVPLYHCFGMGVGNLGCIATGATMVYPAATFDALETLRCVDEERCTSLYGVPTMFIAQLEHPDFSSFEFESLRTGMMGGAPCPVEVMKRVIDDMHAAEVCIISFITRPDDALDRRVSTVGQVAPGVDVKIVDPTHGNVVARGVPGEICTRGYLVMPGYWENPRCNCRSDRRRRVYAHW